MPFSPQFVNTDPFAWLNNITAIEQRAAQRARQAATPNAVGNIPNQYTNIPGVGAFTGGGSVLGPVGGTTGTPSPTGGTFNPSPSPTTGTNAFGMVPGQIGLPDPAADLRRQIPGLSGLNTQASDTIASYLSGELPADVQAQIQDAAAQYGVSSGIPGAGLQRNRTARDLGLTSLDLTGRGLAAYGPYVSAVSGTQTLNPALQTQIASQNAINAAAPNPTLAASYAKQLYDDYLSKIANSRTGGPSGGINPMQFAPRYNPPMPNYMGGYGGYGGAPYLDQAYGYTPAAIAGGYGGVPQVAPSYTGIDPMTFQGPPIAGQGSADWGIGQWDPWNIEDWSPPGITEGEYYDWFGE